MVGPGLRLHPEPPRDAQWRDLWGDAVLSTADWFDVATIVVPAQNWFELQKLGIGADEDGWDDIEWRMLSNNQPVYDYTEQSNRRWGFLHNPEETYHLIEPQGKRVPLIMQARRLGAVSYNVAARLIGYWWPDRSPSR